MALSDRGCRRAANPNGSNCVSVGMFVMCLPATAGVRRAAVVRVQQRVAAAPRELGLS